MSRQLPALERVIDREDERKLFLTVLAQATGPAVITVYAESGSGKSSFLELMAELARSTGEATSLLTKLDPGAEVMWLADKIHDGLLMRDPELRTRSRFAAYKRALATCDYQAFGFPLPPQIAVHNTFSITESDVRDNTFTGTHVSMMGWSDGHDQEARRICLDALLDDLRDLSRRRRVVLLLDQYERATDATNVWLEQALLTRILHGIDEFGPLVICVASTKPVFPTLSSDLGKRSAEVLHAIDGLSPWRDEHIVQWLHQHGKFTPKRVAFIRHGLDEENWSLQKLQEVAELLKASADG